MNGAGTLQTVRLDLEPVRVEHAREAWLQLDDERLWRFFPSRRPATMDDLQRLYEKWERGCAHANEVWCNWVCRERWSGALAGSVQATIFPKEAVGYIAYMVYARYQRKGYAREASQAVITYVRATYSVNTFFAEMDTRNAPSYRLAESLGFRRVERHESVEGGHGIDAEEYVYELRL